MSINKICGIKDCKINHSKKPKRNNGGQGYTPGIHKKKLEQITKAQGWKHQNCDCYNREIKSK